MGENSSDTQGRVEMNDGNFQRFSVHADSKKVNG